MVSGLEAYIESRIGLPTNEDDMKGRNLVSRFLCNRWTSESLEFLVDDMSDLIEDDEDSLVEILAVSMPSSRILSVRARSSASSFMSSGFGGRCMDAMMSSTLESFPELPEIALAAFSAATLGSAANTIA